MDSNSEDKSAQEKVDVEKLQSEIGELKEALTKERKTSEDYLNRLKYLQADLDNFQKRMLKEKEDIVKYASEKLIIRLLDILDDLERAINIGKDVEDKEALIAGINVVFKELNNILEKEGLRKIDSIGKNFNPNEHESLSRIETEKYPDDIVVEELRRGYTLKGKVIRPSMVKVAKHKNCEEDVNAT